MQVENADSPFDIELHFDSCCVLSFELHSTLNLVPYLRIEVGPQTHHVKSWWTDELVIAGEPSPVRATIRTNADRVRINAEAASPGEFASGRCFVRRPKLGYDCHLAWHVTTRCNLRCEYCFLSAEARSRGPLEPIDIATAKRVLAATGRTFNINFSGGEPFLVPNFSEACQEFAESHSISVISNLVTGEPGSLAERIAPSRIDYFLASFHYAELVRTGRVGVFLKNYERIKRTGVRTFLMLVLFPPLLGRIDEVKTALGEHARDLSFEPFIGSWSGIGYPAGYTEGELSQLGIDRGAVARAYEPHGVRCNAGFNAGTVSDRGEVYDCFDRLARIGNIYQGIEFFPVARPCDRRECHCPVYQFHPALFEAAAARTAAAP